MNVSRPLCPQIGGLLEKDAPLQPHVDLHI